MGTDEFRKSFEAIVHEMFEGDGDQESWDEIRRHLTDLYRNLPDRSVATGPDELDRHLTDWLMGTDTDTPPDPDFDAYKRMLELREFRFRLPLATGSSGQAEWHLGGRSSARIVSDSDGCVRLEGTVKAIHVWGAARSAERLAQEVSGCLHCLGLTLHRAMPFPGVERAEGIELYWTQEDHDCEEDVPFSTVESQYIQGTRLAVDEHNLDDIERQRLLQSGPESVFEPRVARLRNLFEAGGPPSKRIRTAARFLYRAVKTSDPGDCFVYLMTAVEGLMVSGKGELTARAADAVALRVGSSFSEREVVRKLISKAYAVRSKYLHEGAYVGDDLVREEVLQVVARLIRGEIAMVDKPEGHPGA